jgi:membrane protein implicated in regulation of membrane protease activity
MDDMGHDARSGGDAAAVEMHLNRGIGIIYCAVTAVVLLLVLAGIGAYLSSGRLLMALVAAGVGLAVAGFLAMVTAAMLLPALTLDRTGVRGRTARGNRIAAGWGDITLDVDENAAPGTIRMNLDGASLSLSGRSWLGFRDFVILVAGTPAAASRLTQPARAEVVRLLQISNQRPGNQGDRPT